MTPIEQNIAIAKACPNLWQDKGFIWSNQGVLIHPFNQTIIDPLSDLNACHEMEKILTQKLTDEYRIKLSLLCRHQFNADSVWRGDMHATAAQRSEAFLRALGKWKSQS